MKKALGRVAGVLIFLLMCGFVCMPTAADAYSIGTAEFVDTYRVEARDKVYAGLYEIKLNGVEVLAMCDDRYTSMLTNEKWKVAVWSQGEDPHPGKFDENKYSHAAYFFKQTIGQNDSTILADLNEIIWHIMSGYTLTKDSSAETYYLAHSSEQIVNWGSFMQVLTATPDSDVSQELLMAVPEPSTMLLLGFGLVGLAAVGRKRFH